MYSARLLIAVAALGAAARATPAADAELPSALPALAGPMDLPPAPPAFPEPVDASPSGLAVLTACTPCSARTHGFAAGAGVTIMQARFDNNLAIGVQGPTPQPPGGGAANGQLTRRVEIDRGTVAAPEVWLGYMTESGFGARVRYWQFWEGTDQVLSGANRGANSTFLVSAAPLGLNLINVPSTMEVTSKLHLQVLDVEGRYAARAAGWNALLSSGVRVARIDQAYNAFVPQVGNSALFSTNTFSGAGPTVAADLRHAVCRTGFNLYGSARYSLVFGEGRQDATIPDKSLFAQDRRDLGIGVAELELGLEYDRAVGPTRVLGQVAFVGQNWRGAGSASRSSVNVVPGGSFVGASYTGESDINFLGLAFRLGVSY